ncbi:hypothetical protein [Streptomyces fuscichromogenes]|uniref:hypothetical protein n=1 Tax=Streptomyces fuscichromogenes TaxID=1324013 RepID=UPI001E500DC8|nr:hypothetical protein [Streptomyces fuscichromogenes]
MRTPRTGLQLALERGLAREDDARLRPVPAEALATTERLHHTVEEVLRLSRSREAARRTAGSIPVRQLLRETGDGRRENGGTASSRRTVDDWSAPTRTFRSTSVFRARPCRRCSESCSTTPGCTGAVRPAWLCGIWTMPRLGRERRGCRDGRAVPALRPRPHRGRARHGHRPGPRA